MGVKWTNAQTGFIISVVKPIINKPESALLPVK